jgi:8-oxo-dGTP diphosphatase
MYYAYMRRALKPGPVAGRSAAPAAADSEEAFLASYDITRFERPSVAVDVVVLSASRGSLEVAVYQRAEHPARGKHALPGGFIQLSESLDHAADRLLGDKVGLAGVYIDQLRTFGDVGRDPRGRIITVAYFALVPPSLLRGLSHSAAAARGARIATVRAPWAGQSGGPVELFDQRGQALPLAFDHAQIIGAAVARLRATLDETAVAYAMLPREFTLRELQDVHEAVRGEALNKDSFRRRMLASGALEATGALERDTAHRPAELYRSATAPPQATRVKGQKR